MTRSIPTAGQEHAADLTPRQIHWIVVSIVFFTFICYLTIGIAMAILPRFVHGNLGFATVLAGVTVSAQYFISPINRSQAGRMADSVGAKPTVMTGLCACALSGLSLPLAFSLSATPWASLTALLAGRVILGFGESWVGTGAIVWGIGRVGPINTARVISYNGMTTYGAIALGAPLGVWLNNAMGLSGVGWFMTALAVIGLVLAIPRPGSPVLTGKRMPIKSVLGRVTPFGLALGAGSVGFGAISSFITLFYAHEHWTNAAFALTAFGSMFVAVRLVLTQTIGRFGGYAVGIACLAVETIGLLAVAAAPSQVLAMVGAGIAGAGMALLFPALGVEAVALVPPTNRGSALGIFNVFLDLSLGITGPAAGILVGTIGYRGVYAASALAALVGTGIATLLFLRARSFAAEAPVTVS